MFLKILAFILPWRLRRLALQSWFGYTIHPTARIGLSWIYPHKLSMAEGARIGHLNIAIHLDGIEMGVKSSIARSNWITGFPSNSNSKHFSHQAGRQSLLILGECAAITKNHHFDCTNVIRVGRFTTVAGYQSQFLTHSIDVIESRQHSEPITIGEYAFVGTNVVMLGGADLPSRCVLGAKSLLNKAYTDEWTLYGGVPAKPLQVLPANAKYFNRADGFVY
ncbi:acyltransferase [Mucilaginibacter pallidiroseus]|uniref:Acyltransferase n=1 Tax=Mucilaginibacter pallidiroseus TaxID=2599295 RepID=A0A563U8G9_9SPHI|nr:acyltransferase [Mucilaginibacter pallidiroseus]TWR27579.1 acyltransferase [Mucilaginibacter pallidiroseus]